MTGHVCETVLRVRYAETDAMGVVHHASYPIWFEIGRGDWLRELGMSYRDIEAGGHYLMLSGLNVEYRQAARYDDELRLLTRLESLGSRGMTFSYELFCEGRLLARGESRHVVTDHHYRPRRLPEHIEHRLNGQI